MPASLHSLPPPSKRQKTQGDATGKARFIKQLEQEIISAVGKDDSLNPLADLLALLFDLEDAQDTSKAIYSLYRVFFSIIVSGKLSSGGDEATKVVKTWLWEKFMSFADFLGGLLQDDEKFLRVRSLLVHFYGTYRVF